LHSGQIFSIIFVPYLAPSSSDQPAALIFGHLIFLDRAIKGGLFVRRIDDADKLRGRTLDVINGPGLALLRLARSVWHCANTKQPAPDGVALRDATIERLAILPVVPGNFSFAGSHAFAERWAALPA
jgi:hypothetical protein